MRISITLVLTCILVLCAAQAAPTAYNNGVEPPLPEPLPKQFADYQLLPLSQSPDNNYGLIYPKRSRLYELSQVRLVLAKLYPFKALAEIPRGYSNLAFNANNDYSVTWYKDSSAFVMVEGIKWGADKVYLGELLPHEKVRLTDITAKIVRKLRPHYVKSGAKPYNDKMEFIFDQEDRGVYNKAGELIADRGWEFTPDGNLKIDCTCTTNPKPPISKDDWTVKYTAIWDRQKRCLTNETIKRY